MCTFINVGCETRSNSNVSKKAMSLFGGQSREIMLIDCTNSYLIQPRSGLLLGTSFRLRKESD
jgi:hypothetical protein